MASINPIRYRGYYFDGDTGLYYLKSRYYDPELARFINADDYVSSGQGILGCNMFAYCLNSPVVHADYTGNIAGILVATLTLAASNPLIAVALVTGTAVLLKLAFEATARVVYEVGLAAEHLNNAVYSAKKANSNNSRSGMVDAGGGAASPAPPGNGNWNNRNGGSQDRGNWQNVKENYLKQQLKKQGTDPHTLKKEYLGKKAEIKLYDIYKDKVTGRLAFFEKSTGRMVVITDYFI